MEITSDTTKIRLAAFQLDGEAQVWWNWVKTSKDLEAMTWAEFHELFMGKYFPATARHAKAQEFLDLRQGTMTVLEYVARFTELTRFADDYVAMDMAKVRKFKNGLKLSIRGKIVGLHLQDMDSMVETVMTIERDVEDARSTQDAGASGKRKESQSSSSSGKKPRASSSRGFQGRGPPGQGQIRVSSQVGQMVCFHCQQPGHMRRDCPQRQGSQGLGTVQSQSTVGQERIQFIPPHLVWVRGASISLRELHGCLPLHRQAKGARLWVEAKDGAHRQGRQGFKGVFMPSHHRQSPHSSHSYRVHFCSLAYGQEYYLILVHHIHSSLHQS